ncbi:hypothetical protein KP509_03G063000 [Ceratopteris richardii]|uniref:Uncharacterized protein n=1 Tax=Ceratopteris richardii TaxID=49495 RepID=A0A8T2V0G0_CERRI|nr:hypothetical protein KP509_03G063000 [Ceratopteris richardii]
MCHQQPTTWGVSYLGVLWAYKTAYKAITGHNPFQLLYGIEVVVPLQFIEGSPRVGTHKVQHWIKQAQYARIHLVEELRERAQEHISKNQLRRKANHDRHIWERPIKKQSLVLLYQPSLTNKKEKKLFTGWKGPYKVVRLLPRGAVQLAMLQEMLPPLFLITLYMKFSQRQKHFKLGKHFPLTHSPRWRVK